MVFDLQIILVNNMFTIQYDKKDCLKSFLFPCFLDG